MALIESAYRAARAAGLRRKVRWTIMQYATRSHSKRAGTGFRPSFHWRPRIGRRQGVTGVASIEETETGGNRRDFLYVATGAAGAIAAGAAVWPMINQMNPSADVQALSSIQVDVAGLEPGSQLTVKFLGKPVFIRRRTEDEIAAAQVEEVAALPDQVARNPNIAEDAPATDANRAMEGMEEWLVMIGVCTHLGCVPLGDAGDFGGWFCPCHGSHYDTAGRIRKGPAPENLHIPVATFVSDTVIQLG
jgi:ubiquinol-cytochrome c reductase iron-sulfur subunit